MLLALLLLAAAPPSARPANTLGNAKEVEPPPAEVKAPAAPAAQPTPPAAPAPAPCPDADTALARALAFAAEPGPEEIRVIAIEDLGFLGDARVLNPLALFMLDPNPAIQQAAIRAVRLYPHPRAEEILSNLIRHPFPSEAAKALAVDSLAFQRTRSAQRFLEHLRDTPQYPSRLQNAARQALQRGWPKP